MIRKVEIAGVNTAKLPVLSNEEKQELLPSFLFQIGCVGLIKAIDNFDITQDVQFSTYRSSDDNWRNKKIFKR